MTKIAIISDSHDHISALKQALSRINACGAEVLLHCGDLCAPFMLDLLGQNFKGPIHVVFGNNDGDGRLLQTVAAKHAQIKLYGIYAELTVGPCQIAMIHYPEPAKRIAQAGCFDLVCYGHNHEKHLEQLGKTCLLNPGELLELKGQASFALYNTDSKTAQHEVLG